MAVRERAETMPSGLVVQVKRVTHAWSTDPFSPLLSRARQALSAAGCAVRPGKWKLSRLGMGTAGSVLSNEFHIPTIGYGPGREEEAHSQNESVEIAKIVECTYGTARWPMAWWASQASAGSPTRLTAIKGTSCASSYSNAEAHRSSTG